MEFHHHLLTEGYKAQTGGKLLPCLLWKLHGNMTQVGLSSLIGGRANTELE